MDSSSFNVLGADHFVVTTTAGASQTAGSPFNVTVTAKTAGGATVTNYTGTVDFSSSDNGSSTQLPASYTFLAGDHGTKTFTGVSLTTVGSQTVVATDDASSLVNGSSTVNVVPAAAASLQLSAPASTTAGTGFATTVTAQDAYGNTATGYTGTVTFSGGGTSPTLPGNYTFTGADDGSHTFTGVTLTQAGSRTVTATDTGTGSITGTSGAINVGAATADHLVFAQEPTSLTAGGTIAPPVKVDIVDTYGNVTSATGPVAVTIKSGTGDPTALLTGTTVRVATAGEATFDDLSIDKAATGYVLTAADASDGLTVTTVDSTSFTVTPVDHFNVTTTASSPLTAGGTFNVTVTAKDAGGTTVTNYDGTVDLSSTDPQVVIPSQYTFVAGDHGSHTFTGVALKTTGSQTITAADDAAPSVSGTSAAVTVVPAATTQLGVTTTAASPQTAGGSFDVTVTAEDAYGNTTPSYTGTIHVTGGGAGATLPGDYSFVAGDHGVKTFTGVTLVTAGSQTITATDTGNGSITGQASVTVGAATAARLALTPTTTTPVAGAADNLTITAFDAYGNTATGYTGDKLLTFLGASSIGLHTPTVTDKTGLPVAFGSPTTITFTSGVASVGGSSNGAMTLYKAAPATILVSDGTIDDSANQPTVTATPAATTSVLAVPSTSTPVAGSSFDVTLTAADTYGNTTPAYRGQVDFTRATTARASHSRPTTPSPPVTPGSTSSQAASSS